MDARDLKFTFCFPSVSKSTKSSADFVKNLMTSMHRSGSINYAGYMEDKDLEKDLLLRLGSFDRDGYKKLSPVQKSKITTAIRRAIGKCEKLLQHPELPIYVFIFPWFPDPKDSKLFGGVNAVAPHANVIHLFIDESKHTLTSVTETVAHEYNHLIFYTLHPAKKYTLLQHILIEGLAENFREDAVGGKPAPWADALSLTEAKRKLREIVSLLGSRSDKVHQEVLFGNKKYPRWMGYAIGYHLVKEFRRGNPDLAWSQLESTSSKEFIWK